MQFLGASRHDTAKVARVDPGTFRDVMREVAAPVAIVAAGSSGHRNGLTATAVCSVSDTPPTVLVCVKRNVAAHDVIVQSGCFSINFLSGDQEGVAVQFSGVRGVRGEDRFLAGEWSAGITGAPVLKNSVCTLECQLVGTQPIATHTIFFGELVAGSKHGNARALLYRRGRYQSLPPHLAARREQETETRIAQSKLPLALD